MVTKVGMYSATHESVTVAREQRQENTEAVVIVNRNIEICKDGEWGWIVCISAALVRFLVLRIYSRFGFLYIVFLREYGWGKVLTDTKYKIFSFSLLHVHLYNNFITTLFMEGNTQQ